MEVIAYVNELKLIESSGDLVNNDKKDDEDDSEEIEDGNENF